MDGNCEEKITIYVDFRNYIIPMFRKERLSDLKQTVTCEAYFTERLRKRFYKVQTSISCLANALVIRK